MPYGEIIMGAEPIAILCADIHLSHKPPVWRSAEPDWYEAMKRPLLELSALQRQLNVPILCAGDIFDRWNAPAELINFALTYLPYNMHAIPGQHDLPNHNIEEINKSAFWTLVQTERIKEISNGVIINNDLLFYGYPYNESIKREKNIKGYTQICLAHQYVWTKGASYQTVSLDSHIKKQREVLQTYDVCVFGDNHIHFTTKLKNTPIWNCGSLMRRHSDQIDYVPQLGILYENKTILPYVLDISEDRYIDVVDFGIDNAQIDLSGFIKELEKLGDSELNFIDAVKVYLRNKGVSKPVQKILLGALER